MKLIFATNNTKKLEEVRKQLNFDIISLKDAGINEDIPEDHDTLEENALQKAKYIYSKTGINCFADDTGLLVDALNGEPGVYSARYAGNQRNDDDNMNLVLSKLKGKPNRSAHFKTVIALIINGEEYLFKGIAEGTILTSKKGDRGFGYDPIFQPYGFNKSFAEISIEEKNKISHRGKAVKNLVEFLNKIKKS